MKTRMHVRAEVLKFAKSAAHVSFTRALAASVALHCRVSSSNQRRILRLPCVRIEYILARRSHGRDS